MTEALRAGRASGRGALGVLGTKILFLLFGGALTVPVRPAMRRRRAQQPSAPPARLR